MDEDDLQAVKVGNTTVYALLMVNDVTLKVPLLCYRTKLLRKKKYVRGQKYFNIALVLHYNFHSSCKHMHLSFKSVCNKEHKGVICILTSLSNYERTSGIFVSCMCDQNSPSSAFSWRSCSGAIVRFYDNSTLTQNENFT